MRRNVPGHGPGDHRGRFWHGGKIYRNLAPQNCIKNGAKKILDFFGSVFVFTKRVYFNPGSFFFIPGGHFLFQGPTDSARTPTFGSICWSYPATFDSPDVQTSTRVFLMRFLAYRGRSVGRGRSRPRGSRPVGSFGDDQV